MMKLTPILLVFCVMLFVMVSGCVSNLSGNNWDVHDMFRPQPPIMTPMSPPSDAIVLFDGSGISQWIGSGGEKAQWKVENGYMEVNGTGNIHTKEGFGDCQLHIEWATPVEVTESSQGRGNSGIFLMGKYEVQVLDSYDNKTYPDGQAGAIYGQYPPLVNACREAGEWQSYDIIFRRPRFSKGGKVIRPAYISVLHNGIVIQNNVEILGKTGHKKQATYQRHADKFPLMLQDHGNPVRFRNIWICSLEE